MNTILASITLIAIAVALSLFLSLPVMWLWNGCLVGAIAGVAEVTWLQAWGISVLSALLFKPNITTK